MVRTRKAPGLDWDCGEAQGEPERSSCSGCRAGKSWEAAEAPCSHGAPLVELLLLNLPGTPPGTLAHGSSWLLPSQHQTQSEHINPLTSFIPQILQSKKLRQVTCPTTRRQQALCQLEGKFEVLSEPTGVGRGPIRTGVPAVCSSAGLKPNRNSL